MEYGDGLCEQNLTAPCVWKMKIWQQQELHSSSVLSTYWKEEFLKWAENNKVKSSALLDFLILFSCDLFWGFFSRIGHISMKMNVFKLPLV